jgi:hypothetical protein
MPMIGTKQAIKAAMSRTKLTTPRTSSPGRRRTTSASVAPMPASRPQAASYRRRATNAVTIECATHARTFPAQAVARREKIWLGRVGSTVPGCGTIKIIKKRHGSHRTVASTKHDAK